MLLKWSLVVLVIVLQVHRTQSLNFLKLAKKVGSSMKDRIIPTTPPPEPTNGSVFKSLFSSIKGIPKKVFKNAKQTVAQEVLKQSIKGMIGGGGDSDEENEVNKKGKTKSFGTKLSKLAGFFL